MEQDIKKAVRENYARIATEGCCCGRTNNSCCGGSSTEELRQIGQNIGYTEEDLASVPEGANLGLGCGNPIALASIKEGETVLDLGSGAGFDCFLAAKRTGERGKVIGVDMTPEMLAKARENARAGNYTNVEFRQGEIEALPVEDSCVDVVISNCVINLSPDKAQVFREIFRVLKPGGRMMISDIVLAKPLPENIKSSVEAWVSCIAGAILKDEYLELIRQAGFTNVEIQEQVFIDISELTGEAATDEDIYVISARIAAYKPEN